MSLTEKIKKMNKWKLGVILVVSLFALGAAGHFVFFKANEFPMTENERKMSQDVAKEAIKDLPSDYKIYVQERGWKLEAGKGTRRITYITLESENFSAFIVVDLDKEKAVTIVENRDWTTSYPVLPYKLVGKFPEEPEHKVFRVVGGILLVLIILSAFVWQLRKKNNGERKQIKEI